MRHNHLLFDHPLFEGKTVEEALEPFGFEVDTQILWVPDPHEDPEDAKRHNADPEAYIDSLSFEHPHGFTEIYRGDNEDSEIVSAAVRAKTVFAQLLLCADPYFTGPNNPLRHSYIAVYHERMRQLSTEGFSREHDDEHDDGTLAAAAASYALNAADQLHPHSQGDGGNAAPVMWPWGRKWWKPSTPRRDLVKAGALILAEVERLDRAAAKLSEGEIPLDASDAGGAA